MKVPNYFVVFFKKNYVISTTNDLDNKFYVCT